MTFLGICGIAHCLLLHPFVLSSLKKIKQLDISMLITEKKFGRGQSRIEGVALWVCKVAVVCKLMLVHCIYYSDPILVERRGAQT